MSGLFYSLGRQAAPTILKAKWMLHALTGNKKDIVESEYVLGCLLADIYERKTGIVAVDGISELINSKGERLARRIKNKELKFSFKCDNSSEPNAMALPGGFIYISRPLLDLCRNDSDELAFILAHEMAHVVRGHASKRFITSVAANAISRARIHGGAAHRAVRDMLLKVMERGYSQGQEFEADDFAVRLMHAAGMDHRAGAKALAKIKNLKEGNSDWLSEYFSTHPPISERIARIRVDKSRKS